MKTSVFTAAASIIVGLASSCSGQFSSLTIEKEQSFALAEGLQDSLIVRIDIEYPEHGTNKEAVKAMSENITSVLLDVQYIEMAPESAIESYIEAKAAEYRENNLPILEIVSEDNNSTAVLSWEDYATGHFTGEYEGIISYRASKYTYTGGAHGMTVETMMNFDKTTGALLKESDIFKEGYEKDLSEMLTAHLPEAFENPEDAGMLFQKEISPNGNFSVSEKGITYTFNQYEIGPYSLGIIEVTIPWNEIDNIIKK